MKSASPRRTRRTPGSKRRKSAVRKTASVLDIVRTGVTRFILNDASIGKFQRTIRSAARTGERSSHPLTREVFRRIVRRAIQERERRIRTILQRNPSEQQKRGNRTNDR